MNPSKIITLLSFFFFQSLIEASEVVSSSTDQDASFASEDGELNWLSRLGISIFSPEGAKCLAGLERAEARLAAKAAKMPTAYYINGLMDECGLTLDEMYKSTDEIEISDAESESDSENEYELEPAQDGFAWRHEGSVVYFTKYSNYGDFCAPEIYELYDFLFEGAAYRGNLNRIKELLAKKKDARVTDTEARTRIFYNAVLYLKYKKDKEEAYEIFELLLKAGFYIFEEQQPPMHGDYGQHYMTTMIRDLRALKILLKHDPEWLNKFSHTWNVFDEIFKYFDADFDFEIANFVLDHGADPFMIFNGRNALDVVLSKLDGALMQNYKDYSDRLRIEFGVTPNEKK